MSANDWWNKYVFSLSQKSVREENDRISGGQLFQRMDAATGNERRPMVTIDDMPEPAAGAMRMSADDDDQVDQRHKLAAPAAYKNAWDKCLN